eukprot:CAMPEP_0196728258 /NCGR_PEP_ID=MMETSP1091-20130531/8977_1 /TAXON_ID=302021 /ORGANISM="Rhodomonas sp., Strain CCMP768" /LENGTH=136 /DNA_ID=CAMNT_0042070977 /DNA_START=347 /DNA_END=757 /DNA_ORIENTATION=-
MLLSHSQAIRAYCVWSPSVTVLRLTGLDPCTAGSYGTMMMRWGGERRQTDQQQAPSRHMPMEKTETMMAHRPSTVKMPIKFSTIGQTFALQLQLQSPTLQTDAGQYRSAPGSTIWQKSTAPIGANTQLPLESRIQV